MYKDALERIAECRSRIVELERHSAEQGRVLDKKITQCKHLSSQVKDQRQEIEELKHKLKVEKGRTNHVAEFVTAGAIALILIILYLGGR